MTFSDEKKRVTVDEWSKYVRDTSMDARYHDRERDIADLMDEFMLYYGKSFALSDIHEELHELWSLHQPMVCSPRCKWWIFLSRTSAICEHPLHRVFYPNRPTPPVPKGEWCETGRAIGT